MKHKRKAGECEIFNRKIKDKITKKKKQKNKNKTKEKWNRNENEVNVRYENVTIKY